MTLQEAIKERHSVRRYLHRPLPEEVVETLNEKVDECNRSGRLHIQLVTQETKAFTGLMAYGKFSGVENYFAMVGEKAEDLDERIGYYGEQLVLLSQTLGLNTCWVGLSYRKVNGAYEVRDNEKLACMIAVGYGESQGVSHKVKSVGQVSNADNESPGWFRQGVEAALQAPTAVNQQKFRFTYLGENADGRPMVKAEKSFSIVGYTRMDLGIAKCHFEIGAGRERFEWR